jgi:hypothetical protein
MKTVATCGVVQCKDCGAVAYDWADLKNVKLPVGWRITWDGFQCGACKKKATKQ